MFTRPKKRPTEDSEPKAPPLDHDALDTLAAVLRAFASTISGQGDAALALEAWARHVLVLGPPPDWQGEPPKTRLWRSTRESTVGIIRSQFGSMSDNVRDLQDVVWVMIDHLSRMMGEDVRNDETTSLYLDRLREEASLTVPPEDLRQTVMEAVGVFGQLLEGRRSRQEEMTQTLGERISALSSELEQVRREAELDPLTQLANRGVFDRELARAVQFRAFVDEPIALVLVDIDHFKDINDRYGHTAGDDALRIVAKELASTFSVRSDIVARYGGDEFAAILRRVNGRQALRLAEQLADRMKGAKVNASNGEFAITTSVGVCDITPNLTPEMALTAADQALYAAKAAGRNRAKLASISTDAKTAPTARPAEAPPTSAVEAAIVTVR